MGTREQAVRLRLLDSTAVCGKPHVRWCGRADGRNLVSPTRSLNTLPACALAAIEATFSGTTRYNDRPAYDMECFKEGIGFSKECKLPLDEVTHLLLPIFLGIVRHNLILLRNVRRRTLQPEDGL